MNELVSEWVAKAEGDWATAGREIVATENTNYDAVCFHAQQCIEKYMKALLIAAGKIPLKTHDLVELHRLLADARSDWSFPAEELRVLSRSAVAFRYPGEAAGHEEAAVAMNVCEHARRKLRKAIGLAR